MTIDEPATVATDYVIAVACGWFTMSLVPLGVPVDWTIGFALGSVSALLGGTWHGFRMTMGDRARDTLWMLSLLTFGASAAAFGAGAVAVIAPELGAIAIRMSALAAFGLYTIAALRNPAFGTGGRMALVMLAAFAGMAVALALRAENSAAALVLASVLLNVAGIVVQLRKLAPRPRFNHNDLFHVFQLAALLCLYAAVRQI